MALLSPTSYSLRRLSFPAIDHSVTAMETTSFRFFDLPRELRDMVYTRLYGERRVFNLQTRLLFRALERDRKREQRKKFVPGAFPESSVSHLLSINKQFFFEAMMVWTASKVFTCDADFTLLECLGEPHSIARQVLQHISEVNFTLMIFKNGVTDLMNALPKLARISIHMYPRDLEIAGEDKAAWEDDFSNAELVSIPLIQALLRFRGLKSLSLNWSFCYEAKTQEEHDKLEKNQAQVQALLDDVVTRAPELARQRDTLPTFEQALSASIAARKTGTVAVPLAPRREVLQVSGTPPPLMYHEVPLTEDDLLRLVLSRPGATLSYMLKARTNMEETG